MPDQAGVGAEAAQLEGDPLGDRGARAEGVVAHRRVDAAVDPLQRDAEAVRGLDVRPRHGEPAELVVGVARGWG